MAVRILFVIWSSILVLNCSAQTGFSDWELAYFKKNSTSEQQNFVKKVEFSRSLCFPKLNPVLFGFDDMHNWNVYLKKCFAAFFTEPRSYDFDKTITLVYGLLNLGNYDNLNFHKLLKTNLNDTLWVENIYQSLVPAINESWQLLDPETRSIYSEILNHSENYLRTFNYKSELRYLNDLKKAGLVENFIRLDSDSKDSNAFRKADAFVFRRIHDSKHGKGNWTGLWIMKMIKRLKSNLDIK